MSFCFNYFIGRKNLTNLLAFCFNYFVGRKVLTSLHVFLFQLPCWKKSLDFSPCLFVSITLLEEKTWLLYMSFCFNYFIERKNWTSLHVFFSITLLEEKTWLISMSFCFINFLYHFQGFSFIVSKRNPHPHACVLTALILHQLQKMKLHLLLLLRNIWYQKEWVKHTVDTLTNYFYACDTYLKLSYVLPNVFL